MLTPARVSAAAAARSARLLWRAKDSVAQVNRRVPDGGVALTFDDGPQPGTTVGGRPGSRPGCSGRRTAAFWWQATVRKPSPVLRSVACLVVPAPGWAIARRLKRGRVAAVPTPPWLADLLAEEHRRLVAAG